MLYLFIECPRKGCHECAPGGSGQYASEQPSRSHVSEGGDESGRKRRIGFRVDLHPSLNHIKWLSEYGRHDSGNNTTWEIVHGR